MRSLDFTSQLNNILCPVTILCGKKDTANLKASKQLKELLPQATLHIVPNAGHELNKYAPNTIDVYKRQVVIAACAGGEFTAKGKTVKHPGWKALEDAYRAKMKDAEPKKEGTVKMHLNTGISPCIITPVEDSDNFIYMVLPVRLKAQ